MTKREKEGQGSSHPEPSQNTRSYKKYVGVTEKPLKTNAGDDYWTRTDIEFLQSNYPSPLVTAAEVATELGRTRNAVLLKASRLGISKDWEEKKWE